MYTGMVLGAEATRNVFALAIANHVATFVQAQRERVVARHYTLLLVSIARITRIG
jgi:hypothetical protein